MPARVASHTLPATPSTCFWGYFDNWRIGPGARMYYPVFHAGAQFFAGDPHMAEGDGELSGTALECSANVRLRLTVRQDLHVTSLEMLAFLTTTQRLSRDDAYSLMSVAADFGITQVVDYRQGVHCGVPKRAFS
jgi:acetamidase/formamidase